MRIPVSLYLIALLVAVPATAQPTTAEEVLQAHIEAAGGAEALSAITSRYSKGEASADTPVGPVIVGIEQWVAYPGYGLIKQTGISSPPEIPAEMLEQKIFLTPDGGWIESAQVGGRMNLNDLPAAQRTGLSQQRRSLSMMSEEMALLADDTLEVELDEPRTVKDTDVYVVKVGGEMPTRRMYAVDSGLLFATETTTPVGIATQYFSDYRTISGVRVPFVVESEQAGNTSLITFSEIAFDREITPESITAAAEGN